MASLTGLEHHKPSRMGPTLLHIQPNNNHAASPGALKLVLQRHQGHQQGSGVPIADASRQQRYFLEASRQPKPQASRPLY